MATYIPLINKMQDSLRETRQRLSSMLSYTEQEMQRLEVLSEALNKKANDLKQSSSATPLLSRLLETELEKLHEEAGSGGLTVEEYPCGTSMRRLSRYFRELEQ